MRLAYLGTPNVAVSTLRALHEAGHEIAVVVTGTDVRRGRGSATSPSPVKAAALDLGLGVTHNLSDVAASGVELAVVVAYGRIIPAALLAEVPMINLHFSLLPRWRGAAPVERAILAGDECTGVCVMDVAERLDEGDVYDRVAVPIGADVTAEELRADLAALGSRIVVDRLANGLGTPAPQTGEATYAHKITSADRRLDWTRPAVDVNRVVRIGDAHTTFRGDRFKVHRAEVVPVDGRPGVVGIDTAGVATVGCGDGSLRLLEVQPAGSLPMTWEAWANGAHPTPGEPFGDAQVRSGHE